MVPFVLTIVCLRCLNITKWSLAECDQLAYKSETESCWFIEMHIAQERAEHGRGSVSLTPAAVAILETLSFDVHECWHTPMSVCTYRNTYAC